MKTPLLLLIAMALVAPLRSQTAPTPAQLEAARAAVQAASDAYLKLNADLLVSHQALQAENEALRQQVAASAGLQQQVAALTAQLQEAQAALVARTQERDAARTELRKIATLAAPFAVVEVPQIPIAVKLSGSEDTAPTFLERWRSFTGALPGFAVWFLSNEGWDTTGSQFGAASYHLPRANKLGVPIIFSLGLGPSPPGSNATQGAASLDSIIAGTRDASFRRELTALAAFRLQDPKQYVRLGWECNGTWFGWSNDATKYKAAFRRVVALARTISPRLQIIWNVNAGEGDVTAWFPGNDVVDVISFDIYPRAANTAADFARLRDHATSGFARISDFAIANGKPLAIDEWGAQANSGAWVDLFAAWIRARQPALLWHGYWDNGPEVISTGTSGTTGARYLAHFGGS